MVIKSIVDEDFVNYKEPVMYIGTSKCGGKCCIEAGIPISVCINDDWRAIPPIDVDDDEIIHRYLENKISKAICFAGLEPFEQFDEMLAFIDKFREEYGCEDTIVIYTGYYESEIKSQIKILKAYPNIIVKFGRYKPDAQSRYDDVLGVILASDNQYAKKIS